MDDRWRIELFGGLCVRRGAQTIAQFRTHKTAALLAYLAFYPRLHAREELAELIWPDNLPESRHNNLRVALSSLRHQLEPSGVAPGTVFAVARGLIGLHEAAIASDAAGFQAACDEAQRAGKTSERLQHLSRAVKAYRGELLLGFYEEWIALEQRRLEDLFFGSVQQLTEILVQLGDYKQALSYAESAVGVDPLREESHCHLMRLLNSAGQTPAALRQYHQLEHLLHERLGGAPSSATRSLFRELEARTAKVGTFTPPLAAPALDHQKLVLPLPPIVLGNMKPARCEPSPKLPIALELGTLTFLLLDKPVVSMPDDEDEEAVFAVLTEQNAWLRREIARHNGYLAPEGAATLLAAFGRAADAARCAVALQKVLCGGATSTRLVLGTGDVQSCEGRYQGAVLDHLCSLLEAAQLGQIVCEAATAALLPAPGTMLTTGAMPSACRSSAEARLRELGLFHLPPMDGPEWLFQVEPAGHAPQQFAPLRAPLVPDYLPLPPTRFFGRQSDLEILCRHLRPPQAMPENAWRLATLTGTGGSGKTRLALEVARRLSRDWQREVHWVPLAELSEPGAILEAVRDSLRTADTESGNPSGGSTAGQGVFEQVVGLLGERPHLLVLDNFEHLVDDGAPIVEQLLQHLPDLSCLITSRRLLGVSGEHEHQVLPLAVPGLSEPLEASDAFFPDINALKRNESMALFVDRARVVQPDFDVAPANAATLTRLCAGLDGIPLALELAAARVQTLPPDQMLAHLQDFLHEPEGAENSLPGAILSGTAGVALPAGCGPCAQEPASPRHRTLHAAMAWSFRLLEAPLRRTFGHLSVFRGGWTLQAAQAICSDEEAVLEHLQQLRQCSLILSHDQDEQVRFGMLETLRCYAGEQLEPLEHAALARRHAHFYVELAEGAEQQMQGPHHGRALARLDAEQDNFYGAITWALQHDPQLALRLTGTLFRYWEMRADFARGHAWTERALQAAQASGTRSQPAILAKALYGAGRLAWYQRDYAAARWHLQHSLDLSRQSNDKPAVVAALNGLAFVALCFGEWPQARDLLEESLALHQQLKVKAGLGAALAGLVLVSSTAEDMARMRALLEQGAGFTRHEGNQRGLALSLQNLGRITYYQGDNAPAWEYLEECVQLWRELDEKWPLAMSLSFLGQTLCAQGDYAAAHSLFVESLGLHQKLKSDWETGVPLHGLAYLAAAQHQAERAACLMGATEALFERCRHPAPPLCEADHQKYLAMTRARLGKRTFAVNWAKGRAMTFEQTVAYALAANLA